MICADTVLDRIGFGKFQWITLLLSGIGFGAATVELVAVSQIKPFIQNKWTLETKYLGYMSTATFLGEIVGGIFWGQLSDSYGRERVFLATSTLMCLFSFALPLADSFTQFCLLRLLLGFAIGGGLAVDFVYFIECVPPRNRSFRSSFIILIGILGTASGIIFLNSFGYKSFLLACSLPSVLLVIGRLLWRYESPKYLVAKGRINEAEQVLNSIARINGAHNQAWELYPEKSSLSPSRKASTSVSVKEHWFLITLACIAFFCQTSAYYGLTLWMSKFMSPWGVNASVMLLAIGLAEIPGLILTSVFLKYFECSKTLLTANFFLASIVSILIYFVEGRLLFILSFCLLYVFIVSIWTILYIHIPEGFPVLCRSRCFAIAGTAGKIGGLLSPILFGHLFNGSGNQLTIHAAVALLFLTGSVASIFFRPKHHKQNPS